MATTSDLSSFYDLRNELYTADQTNTPLLTMSGGLTGGLITKNFDFPCSVGYALPAAAQNVVSEDNSLDFPAIDNINRTEVINTCQIHHHSVQVSYKRIASMDRLSGVATASVDVNVQDEVDFQVARKLEVIARDVEFSFMQGQYEAAATSATEAQTRGICGPLGICATSTRTDQGNTALTLADMQTFFLALYDAGAMFNVPVLFVGGRLKQVLSGIYGYAPTDRNIGGVNVEQLVTDFGNVGIVTSRLVPNNSIAFVEMSVVAPVFQEVPGKGTIFYEEVGISGGSVRGQVYGLVGFDHGPAFAHGELHTIGS